MDFTGDLYKAGTRCLSGISGRFQDDKNNWFYMPHGQPEPPPGDDYELALDDGRRLRIRVLNTVWGRNRPTSTHFEIVKG